MFVISLVYLFVSVICDRLTFCSQTESELHKIYCLVLFGQPQNIFFFKLKRKKITIN